mgnify:CR=1 FL=1
MRNVAPRRSSSPRGATAFALWEPPLTQHGGEHDAGHGEDDLDIVRYEPRTQPPLRAEQQQQSGFQTFLVSLLPFLLLIGVWIYFMNRMQWGGKGGAMGFGKSKAKMLTEKHGRVTFDDVAGIDEAKEELEEIVEFLRNPQKFSRLGGKIPILRHF